MLPGVTTAATTGEHGTGFAGAANAGNEISATCESGDEYRRIGRSVGACRPKMPTIVLPARDRNHTFTTIQNDSDCPGSGRNVFARGLPTPWRGLGLAASTSSLSRRPTWQSRRPESVRRHPRLLAGIRTVNTEPLPGSLATVTSPPIMRASLRDRARPSPVPP